MADKKKILEEELDDVTGGTITYTWEEDHGTIGRGGNNKYLLVDKDAFIKYYNENKDNMSEATIIKNLKEQGVIKNH